MVTYSPSPVARSPAPFINKFWLSTSCKVITGASFTGATEKSTSNGVAAVFSLPLSDNSIVTVQVPPFSFELFSVITREFVASTSTANAAHAESTDALQS